MPNEQERRAKLPADILQEDNEILASFLFNALGRDLAKASDCNWFEALNKGLSEPGTENVLSFQSQGEASLYQKHR